MLSLFRHGRRFSLWVTFVAIAIAFCATIEPDSFVAVERIVAVGDVHGGYDEFASILRAAGVIDSQDKWSGGKTHLVQTGDLLDRGADSRRVMDLVMRLETEALAAGGRVHALLGNHEVMNVTGDLRYVSPGEFAAFATSRSEELRDGFYANAADPARRDDPEYRQQWYKEHPLGWVEHRQVFSAEGIYGKWIRLRHTMVRINDYLFLHGGISPSLAGRSIPDINESVRAEIRQAAAPKDGLAVGRDGPLWYRGLARNAEDELMAHVDRLLVTHGVAHIVVGHTTTPGAIVPRLGGKILLIDVGLSAHYGAHPACLVVQQGKAFALHRGRMLPLPVQPGGDLMKYLRDAAALDPPPSRLERLIEAEGRLPLTANPPPGR